MSKIKKLIEKILQGKSDKNISFAELRQLLIKLGFKERIKGSHHIFTKDNIDEMINLQATKENNSKPYQVKQIRELINNYKLYMHIEDEKE